MSLSFHEFVSQVHSLRAPSFVRVAAGGGASPPDAVKFSPGEVPPTNNMGVQLPEGKEGIEFGVHWYSATSRAPLDDVLRVVTKCLGCELDDPDDFRSVWQVQPRGLNGYNRMFMGPAGAKVCFSQGREDVHFILPGEACEMAGTKRMIELMGTVPQSPTRVDLAWDGIKGPGGSDLSPAWLYGHLWNHPEQVRTRAQIRVDETLPKEKRSQSLRLERNGQGDTCYVGSPSSDRLVRFYDRRGPTRCELQLRREWSMKFVECVLGKAPERVEVTARGFLRDFIEFHDEGGDGVHKWRVKVASWWASFLNGAERVKIAFPRPVRTAVEKVAWVGRQVGPTLKAIIEARTRASVDRMTGVCRAVEDVGRELVSMIMGASATAGSIVLGAMTPLGISDDEWNLGCEMAGVRLSG